MAEENNYSCIGGDHDLTVNPDDTVTLRHFDGKRAIEVRFDDVHGKITVTNYTKNVCVVQLA